MTYKFISEADFFIGIQTDYYMWRKLDDVTADVKYRIENRRMVEFPVPDYLTPMSKGKSWLFELTLMHQPRTGQLLMQASEPWLRAYADADGVFVKMGLTCNNKVITINRHVLGFNFSDDNSEGNISGTERYFTLPEPIRLAYYNRFDGLKIPCTSSSSIQGRLLPNSISEWVSWSRYLEEFKGYKKLYLPWLAERIADVAPKRKTAPWTNFMMFLDSRPEGAGKEGDQLFVKTHILDGVIYHVKDADIENMRILADPVEAIDRYCEHVLLEKEERFDFLPYTVPM